MAPFRIALVCVLLLAAPAVASEPCTVSGKNVSFDAATVRPKGSKPFEVSLQSLPATATLPTGRGAPLSLNVTGPIEFRAEVKRPWLTVTAPFTTPDGLVQAHPGAHFIPTHAAGGTVSGTLVVAAGDVLEGEDKAPEETLAGLQLPCPALSLDWSAHDEDASEPSDGTWWTTRGSRSQIILRAQPVKHASTRTLSTPDCEGCLDFRQVEEREGWLRVARYGEQVVITGWVRRSELQQLPEGEGGGRSSICTGDHGSQSGQGRSGPEPKWSYKGTATLRVGTTLFAAPNRGAWGSVKEETTVDVQIPEGASWAEITRIDGLSGPFWSAFVPVDAVVPTK